MNGDFFRLWERLPDPRGDGTCKIGINEGAGPGKGFWGHNHYKHLKDTLQPWEDLFGQDLSRRVRTLAACDGQRPDKFHVLGKVAAILQSEVQGCLKRPLVLLFDLYRSRRVGSDRKSLGEKWLLVMPVGAMFRVISRRNKQNGESCYFIHSTLRSPDKRWLALVEQIVLAFAKGRRIRSERDVLSPARGRHGISFGQEGQRVRFVTPASWGFVGAVWKKTAVPTWGESGRPLSAPPEGTLLLPLPRRKEEAEV